MAMPAVTEPRRVDVEADVLVGSSASRKSIWAITRFAISSSIYVGRKMMLLEEPGKDVERPLTASVCSTTIGTRPIGRLLFAMWPVYPRRPRKLRDQKIHRAASPREWRRPVRSPLWSIMRFTAGAGRLFATAIFSISVSMSASEG